jgi:hypothetical protein
MKALDVKAPTSKHQHPENLRVPNSNLIHDGMKTFEAWNLELVWSLDVSAWSFSGGSES